jgi:hypothetical protein
VERVHSLSEVAAAYNCTGAKTQFYDQPFSSPFSIVDMINIADFVNF